MLEAVWIFQSAGIKDRQKRCSLALKKDHVNRELPNIHIINDSEKSDNFVNYCNKTIWSEERGRGTRFKGHKEGLWIRGEHEIVKKTVKVSWEDIRNSGFTKSKDRNDPTTITDELTELNESCRVAKKVNNENWTEIICLGK